MGNDNMKEKLQEGSQKIFYKTFFEKHFFEKKIARKIHFIKSVTPATEIFLQILFKKNSPPPLFEGIQNGRFWYFLDLFLGIFGRFLVNIC